MKTLFWNCINWGIKIVMTKTWVRILLQNNYDVNDKRKMDIGSDPPLHTQKVAQWSSRISVEDQG